MKSKIISLLLALCMLMGTMSMLSCADKSTESSTPTEAPTDAPEEPSLNDKLQLNMVDDNYRNWYEIFVYSFYDTNNDGIGDLNGVTQKLDYIKDMGFTGIWLMPIHPTTTYHKYDVIDYYEVDETYGTLEDLKTLVEEAHKRGIKVILDLVLNHSSSSHPWFMEACRYIRENGKPGGKYGDYYNFSDKKLTKYESVSGTNYYYEAQFWGGMPDLNLACEDLRAEIVDIMEYWLKDYDVDGFRLDAVKEYYTGDINKNIEVLSWINTEAKKIKPDCYIVGEAWEGSDYTISRYYESGIDSFFLFTGAQATGKISSIVKFQSGGQLGEYFMQLQETYAQGILAPFLGNHDTMRTGSYSRTIEELKMQAGILSMMNGATFVYYGEEIGMMSKGGTNSDPAKRIAMKWQDKSMYPGMCYLPPENITVNADSYIYPSVEEQLSDPDSIINYYKQAMKLRNCFPAIARGEVENFPVDGNGYVAVMRKTYTDEKITIVFNLDAFAQTVALDKATLGFNDLVGQLCVSSSDNVAYNADGTVTMPPYSIAIFK